MAWPRCPVCRRRDGPDWRLILVDRALGTFGADDEVNRSHLCPCGARWLTVEAVTSVNPPTPRLRGKYDLSQPADTTPLPSATSSATLESLPPSGSRKLKGAE